LIAGHVGRAIEEALMERKKDKEEAGHKKDEEEKRKVDETVEH
jgi:small subunit ribosomal protein S2